MVESHIDRDGRCAIALLDNKGDRALTSPHKCRQTGLRKLKIHLSGYWSCNVGNLFAILKASS